MNLKDVNCQHDLGPESILSNTSNRCMRLLLERGRDKSDDLTTSLLLASNRGDTECLKLILDSGADVNKHAGIGNNTALHVAVLAGHTECLKLILNSGANVDAQDIFGCTALHYASNSGNTECVCELINAGADPIVQNDEGLTAIDLALNAEIRTILDGGGAATKSAAC